MNDGFATVTTLPTPVTIHNKGEDIFITPATSKKSDLFNNTATPSVINTSSKVRYPDLPNVQDSDLATEILTSLQSALSVPLFAEARDEIKEICNKHALHTKGIMKGRDVSRAMVKRKEAQIVELQAEIEGLRSERETERGVIRSLRQDIAVLRHGKTT